MEQQKKPSDKLTSTTEVFSLQEDTESFNSYINELTTQSNQNKAKSLCLVCWCLLSASQKEKHLSEHQGPRSILTPSQFSTKTSFKQLATANGRATTNNGILSFQPISLGPEPHTQIKDKKRKADALDPKLEAKPQDAEDVEKLAKKLKRTSLEKPEDLAQVRVALNLNPTTNKKIKDKKTD